MILAVDQIMKHVRDYWVENYHLLLEPRIENTITIYFGSQGLPDIRWERKQTLSAAIIDDHNLNQSIIVEAALIMLEDALSQFMRKPNNYGRLQVKIRSGTCETIQC